jgi:ABC-type cobalt transport system substrate-binding protein
MCTETIKLIVIGTISLVAIVVICGVICVNINKDRGWGGYSTKLVGITFIVTMALIAYIYDTSNINSSLFALLGTLAGYFMGYRSREDKEDKDSK